MEGKTHTMLEWNDENKWFVKYEVIFISAKQKETYEALMKRTTSLLVSGDNLAFYRCNVPTARIKTFVNEQNKAGVLINKVRMSSKVTVIGIDRLDNFTVSIKGPRLYRKVSFSNYELPIEGVDTIVNGDYLVFIPDNLLNDVKIVGDTIYNPPTPVFEGETFVYTSLVHGLDYKIDNVLGLITCVQASKHDVKLIQRSALIKQMVNLKPIMRYADFNKVSGLLFNDDTIELGVSLLFRFDIKTNFYWFTVIKYLYKRKVINSETYTSLKKNGMYPNINAFQELETMEVQGAYFKKLYELAVKSVGPNAAYKGKSTPEHVEIKKHFLSLYTNFVKKNMVKKDPDWITDLDIILSVKYKDDDSIENYTNFTVNEHY